jgi:L-alanine-DL-glutamate epimerase-like enolase superfamily enzyme
MARIMAIGARCFTKRFDKPLRNPRSVWTSKSAFLVFVLTDDDIIGVGEAWCEGMSPEVLAAFLRQELVPLFDRADLEDVERLWQVAFERSRVAAKPGLALSVLGALETALWDALAKTLRRPLYRLLGACRDRVDVYASGGLYGDGKTIDDLAAEMRGYVERGFRAVKMKVGGAPLAVDTARVAAVRDAIGPDVKLMVDAVYMLDGTTAWRMASAFEPHDIWFLEAPLPPGDLPGLRRLTARSPIPIAGNEVACGLDSYRDLIVEGGIDVVHLDVNQCGGVGEARRIAALAAAFHRPVSFHSASSVICFAANLHIAASVANAESVEYHCVHQMLFDRVPQPTFTLVEGAIQMPPGAGLGFELDFDDLQRL